VTKTDSQDARRHHQASARQRGHAAERTDDQRDWEKIVLTARESLSPPEPQARD